MSCSQLKIESPHAHHDLHNIDGIYFDDGQNTDQCLESIDGDLYCIRPLIPTMYIGPNAGGVMNHKVWQYKMRRLFIIS